MSNIIIQDLEMCQQLTQQEITNLTAGKFGDAIVQHYGFLNTLLGPYNPYAHQVGAQWGTYWSDILDNAANYGPPGSFSETLYGQVFPFMLSGN